MIFASFWQHGRFQYFLKTQPNAIQKGDVGLDVDVQTMSYPSKLECTSNGQVHFPRGERSWCVLLGETWLLGDMNRCPRVWMDAALIRIMHLIVSFCYKQLFLFASGQDNTCILFKVPFSVNNAS
jgi:hypothetical protein